ncbi:Short/branched chain specific acyl-CoA dehydrogenase, mitochondrial [Smittium mucronatum]|uniref:Short/branched chain specific acyl-CoA dehydrogenase, mitochondrial n=1 Tax=Smittium mucronatum TaxID=133383 RepID=A0A1R0GVX2_9FUNG|nr:Short/branched chain specific acyl-CoA dehydrogenase, mitochondrial [Smittium mucronatum]
MFSKTAHKLGLSLRPLSNAAKFSSFSRPALNYEPLPGIGSLINCTEEEAMMREAARKFATTVIAPKVAQMDENEVIDPEVFKGLFEQGFMGIETPDKYNGTGASFTSAIMVIEELAKVDGSVSVACDVQNTLVNTVFKKYANEDLKQKFLPQLAESKVGSFCLSESGSGSDAFALKTTAEKKSDHWVINGGKMWITNSGEAEIFLVFANTDMSKGYKGITCFVLEKSMGVKILKKEKKLGIRASSTCSIDFDNIKVPLENVVGEVGKGYKIAIEILNEGRIGIAAQMLGIAQGAFDYTLPYLFQRKQFGTEIGNFQGMQFQYAQIAMEIEAARLLVYNAARLKEEGRPFIKEAAMAKLYGSQVAERATSRCVEWLGGVGFTRDFPVEKFYRDCKIGSIYEGTTNIQLQTIAKQVSALYK